MKTNNKSILNENKKTNNKSILNAPKHEINREARKNVKSETVIVGD